MENEKYPGGVEAFAGDASRFPAEASSPVIHFPVIHFPLLSHIVFQICKNVNPSLWLSEPLINSMVSLLSINNLANRET
jgi:hypothetical protein